MFSKRLRLSKAFLHRISSAPVINVVDKRNLSELKGLSVVYSEYGDPKKVLQMKDISVSAPLQHNEVLVKMMMAPVNPSDINMIEGTYFLKPKLPAVVGNEGVGRVLETGPNVKSLKKDDWVIPNQSGFGTWRTFAVSSEASFRKIANDIPTVSAATIAVNPCTAYRMLKDFENLQPGDTVIQNSANSGVGQSVIQIAKNWNLNTINIVRNRDNLEELVAFLKDLGATHVVTEDFVRTPEMKELVKSVGTVPKLALNGVGGKSATELLRHLGNKGTMVTYGGMSKKPVIVPTGVFIFKEVKTVGFWNSQWNVENENNPEKQKMFEELFQMIRENKLIPPPHEIFKIENYEHAVSSAMEGFQDQKKVIALEKS